MDEKLLCPRCGDTELVKVKCGPELELDQCPQCRGLWLDTGELLKVKNLGDFYIKNLEQ
jgi:Zn-finger nucleic acid-binding protein